jgi:hypothetical protein
MGSSDTVLFDKCRARASAKITTEKHRRFFKRKINPCPKCFAEFVPRGFKNYQLVFCEPRKLLVAGHNCSDRIFRGCYLDETLSKSEWREISEGHEFPIFSEFLKTSAKFRRGSLPKCPSEKLPFALERDEIVHCMSSPTYFDEQKPSKGENPDKGDLFVTNKRIIFTSPSGALRIPFENVDRITESQPGFLVKEKDVFEPYYFFPQRYDPVFAAVHGAIHNLKGKLEHSLFEATFDVWGVQCFF